MQWELLRGQKFHILKPKKPENPDPNPTRTRRYKPEPEKQYSNPTRIRLLLPEPITSPGGVIILNKVTIPDP